MTLILTLEGPPGAGKTTLFTALVQAFGDRCVFFTEPNPRLIQLEDADSTWFFTYEEQRANALRALGESEAVDLVLCDRNHLGALAYCFASEDEHAMPFAEARDHYLRELAPRLPALTTVILQVEPDTSLTRRGNVPEHPRWNRWFDPAFLERLHTFYCEYAPALCPQPPVFIKTDGLSVSQVGDETTRATALPKVTGSLVHHRKPATIDHRFAGTYDALGGPAALGHPTAPAIAYRGCPLQMFELGALIVRRGTCVPWNPIAHAKATP